MSFPTTLSQPRAPLGAEALRFARSLVVGSAGTALDFTGLTLALRVFHFEPTSARVVGLLAGAVVLFFGSRSFAFRVHTEGAAAQAKRFVLSELLGLPLSLLAFKLLLRALPGLPPEAVSLLANFALFVTYYYPVRRLLVFKPGVATANATATAAATVSP